MNAIIDLKNFVNKNNIKYDDVQIKFLINRYRLYNHKEDLQQIREMCYPVILGTIKNFVNKDNRNWDKNKILENKLYSNEDLIGEALFVIQLCIDNFDFVHNVSFVTYLWGALMRRYIRYFQETNTVVKKVKRSEFFDIDDFYNQYNEGFEEKDILFVTENEIQLLSNELNITKFEIRLIKNILKQKISFFEYKVFLLLMNGEKKKNIKKFLRISERKLNKIIYKIQLIIEEEINK